MSVANELLGRRTDIYEQTNEKHIIDDCQRIFSSWWINSDFNSDS